jgi:hypothetical protein
MVPLIAEVVAPWPQLREAVSSSHTRASEWRRYNNFIKGDKKVRSGAYYASTKLLLTIIPSDYANVNNLKSTCLFTIPSL